MVNALTCILTKPFHRHPTQTETNKYIYKKKTLKPKNFNWREADQLAIYKPDRRVEQGLAEKHLPLVSQRGSGFDVRRPYPLGNSAASLFLSPYWFFIVVARFLKKQGRKRTSAWLIFFLPQSLLPSNMQSHSAICTALLDNANLVS